MNKFTKLLIVGCLLSVSALSSADAPLFNGATREKIFAPRTEVKAGYFSFASKQMRRVYSKGGFQIQLSGSYPIKNWLHIYGSLGFMEAKGHSCKFDQKTTFWQIPVDLGLKTIVPISSFADWNFALGPRYFYAHQHNHSRFVNRNMRKNGVGLFVNTGFDFFLSQHSFINLFGEYSYESIHPSSSKKHVYVRRVQVGGYYFGAGFGYSF